MNQETPKFIPLLRYELHFLIRHDLQLTSDDVIAAIPDAMMDRLLEAFNSLRITPIQCWTEDDVPTDKSDTPIDLDSGFRDIHIDDHYAIFQRDGDAVSPDLLELAQYGGPSLYFVTKKNDPTRN